MKVKATEMYKKLNIQDKKLEKIPEVGEEFEITEERYEVLTKSNQYKVAFVEKVEEVIETATKKVKKEKAVKKTRVKVK